MHPAGLSSSGGSEDGLRLAGRRAFLARCERRTGAGGNRKEPCSALLGCSDVLPTHQSRMRTTISEFGEIFQWYKISRVCQMAKLREAG